MDEREVSRRDLIGDALRHTMECNAFLPFSQEQIEDGGHLRMDNISQTPIKRKDRNLIWEDGSPHGRSTRIRRRRRHP